MLIKLYRIKFLLYCILLVKRRCVLQISVLFWPWNLFKKKKCTTSYLLSVSPSVNPPTHPFALLICPSSHLAVNSVNKVSALQREQPLWNLVWIVCHRRLVCQSPCWLWVYLPLIPAKLRIKDLNSNLSCHKGGYIAVLKSTSGCKSPEEFRDLKGFRSLPEATLKRAGVNRTYGLHARKGNTL